MDLLALQQRANILVQKVNDYEASIEGEDIDENTELEQHKYADLFCLRPVMKLLFGQTVEEKLNRTLDNDLDLRLFASTVPMYNSSFKLFGILSDDLDFKSDTHKFMNNIDVYNASNMIQLDVLQNTIQDRDSRISQGLNYSYSANIADALATESQVANVFKWNTTLADDEELVNNTVTINRQVPGIVCYYLGNGYTNNYTATVSCNDTTSSINAVNYMFPSTYGAFFNKEDITKSQVQENRVENLAALKLFIPGTHYTRGKIECPQQIWQPEAQYGEDNTTGFNYQGQALYQELVFKDRRANAADNSVDFIPALSDVPDNDPQGLLLRTALAQQKQYYINRPWFNELDSLDSKDLTNLAEVVEKASYVYTYQLNPEINSTHETNYNFDELTQTLKPKSGKPIKVEGSFDFTVIDGDAENPKREYSMISFAIPFANLRKTTVRQSFANNIYNTFYLTWNETNKTIVLSTSGTQIASTVSVDDPDTTEYLFIVIVIYGRRILFRGTVNKDSKGDMAQCIAETQNQIGSKDLTFTFFANDYIDFCFDKALLPEDFVVINDASLPVRNIRNGQLYEYQESTGLSKYTDLSIVKAKLPGYDKEFYTSTQIDYETYNKGVNNK